MMANDTTTDGFEISVDEGAYLVEHLDLSGRLPEVLALYNPMTGPDLAEPWKQLQRDRLTERGILTANGTLPEVTSLVRTIAHAEETLAIRIIPLHEPNTMLRVAIASRFGQYVVASRTRHIFLVQQVPAADWLTATTAVLAVNLGTIEPAPSQRSHPAHRRRSSTHRRHSPRTRHRPTHRARPRRP
ncbi:ESX secretion-associated protein EspG [Mycobacterium servetii]|uniref:ESX secretion-associated protein EspG n=1 Tax=Mycobacterium servetii TaxID=3237418 RepID=A0ABV4CA09_9MYCO